MDISTIKEVTAHLLGEITPIGETHTDSERRENLEKRIELIDYLAWEIYMNTVRNIDASEASRKESAARGERWIKDTVGEMQAWLG